MATKQLERLIFAQGGKCFFCCQSLKKSQASVEHLVATANGGSNYDGNCVACCKALNGLLGSMSLKEKIQVILKQHGNFLCPDKNDSSSAQHGEAKPERNGEGEEDRLTLVVTNLKRRGNAKPRRLGTLTSTVTSLFRDGVSRAEVDEMVQQLQARGWLTVTNDDVTYYF